MFSFRIWSKATNSYWDDVDMNNTYIDKDGDVVYEWQDEQGNTKISKYDATSQDGADLVVEYCSGVRDKKGELIFQGDLVFVEKYQRTAINKEYLVVHSKVDNKLYMVPHDGEEHKYKECIDFELVNSKYLSNVGNINEGYMDPEGKEDVHEDE